MKLEYNILWIEDNEEWLRIPIESIEEAIEEFGFIAKITSISDHTIINKNFLENNDFDLIMVDYKLDNFKKDLRGDDLINEFRHNNIYADVIFYSSEQDKTLYDLVQEKKLQNISVYDRSIFKEENIQQIIQIIEYFLKKELDINSMRGIAMSEVAEFDKKILKMINNFKENEIEAKIVEKIREKKSNNCLNICLKNQGEIITLVNSDKSTIYFDSQTRADFLHSKILKEKCNAGNNQDLKVNYEILKNNYNNEVIKTRNLLAHNSDYDPNEEEKKQIRKDIIKHKKNLEKLNEKLNSNLLTKTTSNLTEVIIKSQEEIENQNIVDIVSEFQP